MAVAGAVFLARALPVRPTAAVVLGSGMGDLDLGRPSIEIPYAKIPGFPRPGAGGHPGRLSLVGRTAVLRGRSHLYEGRTAAEVAAPVRALAALGVRTLVLTNAAGSVNRAYRPGDVMAVRDHLNLTGDNPLRGSPAFVDCSTVYDAGLRRAARAAGADREGVYAAVAGPSYETPAEVAMLRTLGADAVGMSTVPEALAARAAGMRIAALSLIANRGAGLSRTALSHEEVVAASRRALPRLARLIHALLKADEPPSP